ncbi:DUF1801 domain-containing protein [Paracrocinitomix mangrovi]|uniref:DUF1801 domain-containing protein n=1 Tax=Paracrocinitomix mangrovi TaxID=2862509 RepID=UPI001C8DD9B0|nr:DUF1801 domain-containing protein [Paracrocinitomix mangrovi]UKN00783.1 DUF1801 domain-containing protein [Paracrocinitomix mangrovi]
MQDFKFNSYIEFYEYLNDDHQMMVTILRDIIQDSLPDIKEKLSWNVPFYFKNKNICFIWPGSIPWGKQTKKGVELGFTKGYLLKPNDFLEKGNRKQVYIKTFYSVDEIESNYDKITSLLLEANQIDKNLKK